jgi:hypothetical protein
LLRQAAHVKHQAAESAAVCSGKAINISFSIVATLIPSYSASTMNSQSYAEFFYNRP